MNDEELLQLIKEWLFHNDKLREITAYLYKHTELFEKKYEHEFNEELYNFFANKITKYTKQRNILLNTLNEKQLAKLNYLSMFERR